MKTHKASRHMRLIRNDAKRQSGAKRRKKASPVGAQDLKQAVERSATPAKK